jgi:hypothetical protein
MPTTGTPDSAALEPRSAVHVGTVLYRSKRMYCDEQSRLPVSVS